MTGTFEGFTEIDPSEVTKPITETTIKHRHTSRKLKRKPSGVFIAWDGEGVKTGNDGSSEYVLFGNSAGDKIISHCLHTEQCLDLLLESSELHSGAWNIGFAFDYDVNMILRDLPIGALQALAKNGSCKWRHYRITHVPHKWFGVATGNVKHGNYRSIRVSDVFGFFQCSFVKALRTYLDQNDLETLDTIESGKAARDSFRYSDIEMIANYWSKEIALLQKLVETLRHTLMSAGFNIGQWHGPGALANYIYRHNGIKDHKAECPDAVREAAAYAYAGGRFELFHMGYIKGPIYSYDLNSAYPAAIATLPSLNPYLTVGKWLHWHEQMITNRPIREFALYHVFFHRYKGLYDYSIGPLFHRDDHGRITYPGVTEGWYWGPEVAQMVATIDPKDYKIDEAWVWDMQVPVYPFAEFVPHYYDERKRLKAAGNGAERAYKLGLNSLYGKMAQRVGWEHTNGAPKWHQLEWAGYVTSKTRAQLYNVLMRSPRKMIGVETDGIYSRATPNELGIKDSGELGKWGIDEYKSMLYLQNGVYFLENQDGTWTGKYRGLDNGSLNAEKLSAYMSILYAKDQWDPITGPTTRFVGYKAALMRTEFAEQWRHWFTTDREISPGLVGKRIHLPSSCPACRDDKSVRDIAHPLAVNSVANRGKHESVKHFIPWELNDHDDGWLDNDELNRGMVHEND